METVLSIKDDNFFFNFRITYISPGNTSNKVNCLNLEGTFMSLQEFVAELSK